MGTRQAEPGVSQRHRMELADFFLTMNDMYDLTDLNLFGSGTEEDTKAGFIGGCLGSILGIVVSAIIILLCSLFCGCSPRVTETMVMVTDTCYVEHHRRDSIYVHDSTYIHEYQRQDTLFIERVRWRTQWRERIIRDTAYVSKRDTVFIAAEPQHTRQSEWKAAQMWLGRMVMVALAVAVLVYVVRWQLRHNWP